MATRLRWIGRCRHDRCPAVKVHLRRCRRRVPAPRSSSRVPRTDERRHQHCPTSPAPWVMPSSWYDSRRQTCRRSISAPTCAQARAVAAPPRTRLGLAHAMGQLLRPWCRGDVAQIARFALCSHRKWRGQPLPWGTDSLAGRGRRRKHLANSLVIRCMPRRSRAGWSRRHDAGMPCASPRRVGAGEDETGPRRELSHLAR